MTDKTSYKEGGDYLNVFADDKYQRLHNRIGKQCALEPHGASIDPLGYSC